MVYLYIYLGTVGFLTILGDALGLPSKKKLPEVRSVSGVVHVCPENKVVLFQSDKNSFLKTIFSGRVKKGESFDDAFVRELSAKINVEIDQGHIIDSGFEDVNHFNVTYGATTDQTPRTTSVQGSVVLQTVASVQEELKNSNAFSFKDAELLKKYFSNPENCNPCRSRKP